MILNLHIENVALIECADVSFENGLNILSGETGAGKSMLIDAINFVLGGRVSKDFLRTGETLSQVEALFKLSSSETLGAIKSHGVTLTEGELLLSRSFSETGKSTCKINGKVVTIGMLREVSSYLIDVHGQHEHQSLLNAEKHIALLDKFCTCSTEKAKLKEAIQNYKEVAVALNKIASTDASERLSSLKFIVNEIESAKLKNDEETTLLEARKRLSNLEKLMNNCVLSSVLISENEETSALLSVSKAASSMSEIKELDKALVPISENLQTALSILSDISADLNEYIGGLEFNPSALNNIEIRLDTIYNLKKKYGQTIPDVLKYGENAAIELQEIEIAGKKRDSLTSEKKLLSMEILSLCEEISTQRKVAAKNISDQIKNNLEQLGMKDAMFEISVERKKEFSSNGFDKVEFLISTNPGEALKPLAKIASGGEMSRVMLALKTVFANAYDIDTFIFDEIDTGVSGRTAQKVAEKLSTLAKAHQILCITHLPQIAAMADAHFFIEKNVHENKTKTTIKLLHIDEVTSELARLLGGAKITESTRIAAKEMKEMADLLK